MDHDTRQAFVDAADMASVLSVSAVVQATVRRGAGLGRVRDFDLRVSGEIPLGVWESLRTGVRMDPRV